MAAKENAMGLIENKPWWDRRAEERNPYNHTPKYRRIDPKERSTASTVKGVLEDERGMSAVKLSSRVGAGVVIASALGTAAWQLHDNLVANPPPIEESKDSVSGGTSFSNDGSVLTLEGGVPPNLAITTNLTSQPTPESKANKVDPAEVFDNTATEGVFTGRNTVTMTPKQYQDTSPRLINGDNVVIPLPIGLPEGQMPKITFKKAKGASGGKRLINGRPDPEKHSKTISDGSITVNDVLIIDKVPIGSVLLSPFDGEIRPDTSPGYEQPDGSLSLGSFSLYSEDSNGNGITLTFSTVRIKYLIEPSRIVRDEKGESQSAPKRPIKIGDPIGIIWTTKHDNPYYNGQIYITALSSVKENGQRRGGAAGIQIATTPEGKAIRFK